MTRITVQDYSNYVFNISEYFIITNRNGNKGSIGIDGWMTRGWKNK
jgi:hypothetical protein